MGHHRLTAGLGVFSLGLGLTELLAPRWLGRSVGVGDRRPRLVRAFGLREIAAGVAILAGRRPARGMWARFVGDVLDLAAVAAALRKSSHRGRAAAALGAVIGAGAIDLACARRLGRAARAAV